MIGFSSPLQITWPNHRAWHSLILSLYWVLILPFQNTRSWAFLLLAPCSCLISSWLPNFPTPRTVLASLLSYTIFPSAWWTPVPVYIDLFTFCLGCPNSGIGILISVPVVLDHKPQTFEFLNIFDWLATKMDFTHVSLLSLLVYAQLILSLTYFSDTVGSHVGDTVLKMKHFGRIVFWFISQVPYFLNFASSYFRFEVKYRWHWAYNTTPMSYQWFNGWIAALCH